MLKHLTIVLIAALLAGASHAQQQLPATGSYPSKPVRVLVGNPPGGGIDLVARAVAQRLTDRFGRSFVVDNRPGGAGLIGIDLAANAVPDGYTLLVVPGSLVGSAAAQKKVPYDLRRTLAPVTQLASVSYLLMINPAVPARTVKELIAYAKERPNTLNFGSSGVGGIGHLAGELFGWKAGVKMVHVPYKGAGPALVDMMSGQIQLGFTATISGMPHVRVGKLRALGVSSARRAPSLPEIPAIAETGLPGFDLVNWYGLFAPGATSAAVVAALHREAAAVLEDKDVQAMFAKDGADAESSPAPEAFRRLFANEVVKWEGYIKLPGFAEALKQQ